MEVRTGIRIMGALFMLAGAVLLFFFVRNTLLVQKSRKWPTAAGTVRSSQVETYTYTTTVTRNGKDTTVEKTAQRARIDYEYDVWITAGKGDAEGSKKQHYGSHQIYITGKNGDPGLVARYPAGKEIRVYYDPQDFSQAYLEQEATESLVPLIAGLVFGAAGVFIFLSSRQFS